ncbi:MAG: glycosyltransferase family 4 protein [Pirellulales bacterium]
MTRRIRLLYVANKRLPDSDYRIRYAAEPLLEEAPQFEQTPFDRGGRAPCNDSAAPLRLMVLITSGVSADLLKGQLAFFRSRGFDVTLVAAPHPRLTAAAARENITIRSLPMHREIRPLHDLVAFVRLWRLMRNVRPQIVNASTPKAGLLATLAAFLARVPVRIYTLRGLRLETARGLTWHILAFAERVASACAHRVICVSQSLADEFVSLDLADPDKVAVLGAGSSNGVHAEAFERTASRLSQARRLREQFGIAAHDPVIGYVGRLTRDKGIAELVRAFAQVTERFPAARLLLVGDFETGDPPDEAVVDRIKKDPRIIKSGFVGDVTPYYHLMNVLALPSYREGFPNCVLEAQAASLPVVGTRATGVVDAIVDGATGRLVPVGAVDELADALIAYLDKPGLAAQHGMAGRRRVAQEFRPHRIWTALEDEYNRLVVDAALPTETNAISHSLKSHAA